MNLYTAHTSFLVVIWNLGYPVPPLTVSGVGVSNELERGTKTCRILLNFASFDYLIYMLHELNDGVLMIELTDFMLMTRVMHKIIKVKGKGKGTVSR